MASATLRESFLKVAERVESLSGIIDPANPSSLIYAQKVLAEIVSNLGKMAQLGQRIDAANEETKGAESSIVSEIFGLLEQSKSLLEHITRAINIQSRISGTGNARQSRADEVDDEESDESDSESDSEDEDSNEEEEDDRVDKLVSQNEADPLNREEIGKLLILTARAYTSKILSANQRSFLKTQIVARHGMLRVVLQFPTLESIMSALRTISSSVDE